MTYKQITTAINKLNPYPSPLASDDLKFIIKLHLEDLFDPLFEIYINIEVIIDQHIKLKFP